MGAVNPGRPTYNLAGQVFGKLTALYWVHDGKIKWICKCECGNVDAILTAALLRGDRTSWCLNPKDTAYHLYGARGVKVSKEWEESFEAFLRDMGECPPGLQIDRIIPEGNYAKGNCRWVTNLVNSNNRRGTDLSITIQSLTTEQLEDLLQYVESQEDDDAT